MLTEMDASKTRTTVFVVKYVTGIEASRREKPVPFAAYVRYVNITVCNFEE